MPTQNQTGGGTCDMENHCREIKLNYMTQYSTCPWHMGVGSKTLDCKGCRQVISFPYYILMP